jgi:hypothetical protein
MVSKLTNPLFVSRAVFVAEYDGPSAVDDGLRVLVDVECFDEADEGLHIGDRHVAETLWVPYCCFPEIGVWSPGNSLDPSYVSFSSDLTSLGKWRLTSSPDSRLQRRSLVEQPGCY